MENRLASGAYSVRYCKLKHKAKMNLVKKFEIDVSTSLAFINILKLHQ